MSDAERTFLEVPEELVAIMANEQVKAELRLGRPLTESEQNSYFLGFTLMHEQQQKRIELCELGLAAIEEAANKNYNEDRPATHLEELIEQVVIVDLGIVCKVDAYEAYQQQLATQ